MNTKVVKIVSLSLFGAVFIFVLLISSCRILVLNSLRPDAKRVYQYYFLTPVEKIQKLRSGGLAWLDNPVCIKFKSAEKIVLRNQASYSPADISKPQRFFLMEYPHDKKILKDISNLVYISYAERKNTHSNRQYTLIYWLLYNKKTGNYYFLLEECYQ
ncbi:MAG: hypothetical protein PHT53_07155 [Candidatus Omnitrophica bacterium]|nr:hypothetical protein [Candidatus Omnitrophota bacterium]